jgi:hypothetical protein
MQVAALRHKVKPIANEKKIPTSHPGRKNITRQGRDPVSHIRKCGTVLTATSVVGGVGQCWINISLVFSASSIATISRSFPSSARLFSSPTTLLKTL